MRRHISFLPCRIPDAFFLQLLLRIAAASKLLFLSRTRCLFAARRIADESGVVEVVTEDWNLHVRSRGWYRQEGGWELTVPLFVCAFHVVQIKGWGAASLALCARVLSEITSLRNTSFTGLELTTPTAMCCSSGCDSIIGTVQDLATTAMHGMDPNAVVTCSNGHATRLQHFVGLVPDAKSGHAAELQYWLVVADVHTHDSSHHVPPLPSRVRTALAASLVRWSASLWQQNGVDALRCPRVWVGFCHPRDDRLLLRPVCEHVECLHAVRPFQRRDVGTWTEIQASISPVHHDGDGITNHETRAHVQVPVRVLMDLSGRVLALVSSGNTRDHDNQTIDPEDVLDGVTKVVACVPSHANVPSPIFSSVHTELQHPLLWVQVVAHGSGPSDDGNRLSNLWLCKHHADSRS